MTGRTRTCMDCGCSWRYTRGSSTPQEVRCPRCRDLHDARRAAVAEIERLVIDPRGARVVGAALEAAAGAMVQMPSEAGRAGIAQRVHQLARSRPADERTLRSIVVALAASAVLWAAEIRGALDGD